MLEEPAVAGIEDIIVGGSAKYLEVVLGLAAADERWAAQLCKYRQRVALVASLGLSCTQSILPYHIFAFSVLRYVMML